MAIARGACPNCGAPIEFTAGSSIAKVCGFCRHVAVRTDRELTNLGQAADLANTPSTLAVGDTGTFLGRAFTVLGRVQLDYGRGPWDEFYVGYSDGTWGWIAEAQGNVYVTQQEPFEAPPPPRASLTVEAEIVLGKYGAFRVAERRVARVLTAEGELPFRPAPERFYADLQGADAAFATLDYGDGTAAPELFVGRQTPRDQLQVTPRGGERAGAVPVALADQRCPNCGAGLPPPSSASITRVACRYCHALHEVASRRVLAEQTAIGHEPALALGKVGTLDGTSYTVIGFMVRSAESDGESFDWHEYLLFSAAMGFRWLVRDEGVWLFVEPVSLADVQVRDARARFGNRSFRLRNANRARVAYVLGEFYWQVEVGETVDATDYVSGSNVLSREANGEEVSWSYGVTVNPQTVLAQFGAAERVARSADRSAFDHSEFDALRKNDGGAGFAGFVFFCLLVLVFVVFPAMLDDDSGCSASGGSYHSSSYHGGFGGK